MSLPAERELPDAVFVEDAAVVTDEVAIIPRMGALSRRPETAALIDTLATYRPIKLLTEPATLDGGDVLKIGLDLFVGLSQRTNREGLMQLHDLLAPHNYTVHPVEVNGCLHLKSACSYLGRNSVLVNRSWIDATQLREFELIDVPAKEQAGANALLVNNIVLIPSSFPRTRAVLEKRGFHVETIDLSELQKAEAGVTCGSLIFNAR